VLSIETSERSVTAAILASHINDLHEVLDNISPAPVERVVELILAAHRDGRHVYILGNGGSASTASHFACDLSKATIVGDASRLHVTSLTDNVAVLTAWANDTSYERVFAEQLLSLAAPGDVVVIISASGDSPNVLAAARTARELGAATVALVGFAGGALKDLVDVAVQVGSHDYGVVEDCQLVLEHAITASVRGALEG
jgi:D-sedoheptulose 7-phosphate isomerase